MRIYHKKWKTIVPGEMDEVWEFFSDPANLQRITPGYMKFEIQSDTDGIKMYPGMLILYKVSPLANIPLDWATEIISIQPHEYFIDVQRSGPYALWHHEHRFVQVANGVEMIDILHYAVPFGFLGRLLNNVMISSRIDHIFAYRQQAIDEIFQPSMAATEI